MAAMQRSHATHAYGCQAGFEAAGGYAVNATVARVL